MSPACNDVPPKAVTTPGLWLPEACYQRLRGRLRARDTLTQRDGIKLAEAEFRLGNHQLAYREAQRVLRSNAQSEWGLYWLGMSNRELAQDCFSKVASMNPESARVHEMLGEYYAGRHNFPHAETEYMAAIRLAPELADLHMGLGTVYWAGGQWTEAEKELERTLELAPGSAVAHYELGDTYVQERRWQSAIDHLKRALADPNLATKVRVDLAQAEDETGETRKAIDELLPVLNDDKEGEIHYRLARLYRKIGDKTREREALDVFRRRRASSPPSDLTSLEALEKQQEAAERTDTLKPPQ